MANQETRIIKEAEVIEYAVIPWNALNIYAKSKVVKWYASEKRAQKFADKKNAESALYNYVVRPSNYVIYP